MKIYTMCNTLSENPAKFQTMFVTLAKYYLACWATLLKGRWEKLTTFKEYKLFKSPPNSPVNKC